MEENKKGHLHPLTIMIQDISTIFSEMGFYIAEGPEIETEYNNFDALNVAKEHPARDMQDTFWISREKGVLLRTHISALQVPFMKEHGAPLKMVSSGKVYRHEATDATHEAHYHYTEGLVVGEDVSLDDLLGTLNVFFEKLFGKKVEVRLRPSFFPFVEPGVEVDISCFKCGGKGCNVCKNSGWIEVMGAGMVHPSVLEHGGIDPNKYKAFAFGTGVDRLAMLRYGIDDVRLFYTGDLRLTNQF
jgi:phenylalanyl-tRNA synthetase alpha chain